MNEHKILIELQKIDSRVDELDYQEKNLPERDRYLKLLDEVNKIEGLYKAMSKKLHDEALIQKKFEDEIGIMSAKIDKEQKRLYSGTISNAKELSSIQQEVAHLKEQIDSKETDLLEQIEVVDKLRDNNKTVENRLNTRKAELAIAKTEMENILASINGERTELQARRESLYASLSEDTRQLYNRVRTKSPLAVTVLEEGLCMGCRVEMPSTELERILASPKLEKCPNCNRILVKV